MDLLIVIHVVLDLVPSTCVCPSARPHNSWKLKGEEETAAKEAARKAKEKRAKMVLEVSTSINPPQTLAFRFGVEASVFVPDELF